MSKQVLILLLILTSLSGCWNHPSPAPVEILPISQEPPSSVPVISGPQYEVPVTVSKESFPEVAGRTDRDDIVAVISVPASTVPTTLRVYKVHKTVRQAILPTREEPRNPVSVVSNNPEVSLMVPTVTPWWQWLLGFLAVFTAVWQGLSMVWRTVSGPFQLIRKVLGK